MIATWAVLLSGAVVAQEVRAAEPGNGPDPTLVREAIARLEAVEATLDRGPDGETVLGIDLNYKGVEDLSFLAAFPELETLTFTTTLDERQYGNLAHCLRLRGLDLLSSPLTDRSLAVIGQLSELRALRVSGRGVTDEGLAELVNLQYLEELWVLDARVTDVGLAHVAKLKALRVLHLQGNPIRGGGLAALTDLTELRDLDLSNCLLDGDELRRVAWPESLSSLGLDENIGFDDGALPAIAHCRRLETLRLSETAVTSAGMPFVAALPRLQWLSLCDTAVDDTGLLEFEEGRSLRYLMINGTNVRREAAARLMRKNLELEIWTSMYWPEAEEKEFVKEFGARTGGSCANGLPEPEYVPWYRELREKK